MVNDEPMPALLSVGKAVASRELEGLASGKHRERICPRVDSGIAVNAYVLLAKRDLGFGIRGTHALKVLLDTSGRSNDDRGNRAPENRFAVIKRLD